MTVPSSSFLQPVAIPFCQSAHIGHPSYPVCSLHEDQSFNSSLPATNPSTKQFPRLPRPARISAAVVAAAGAIFGATLGHFSSSPSLVSRVIASSNSSDTVTVSEQLRTDGGQKRDSREKVMSFSLTAGTLAALGVWALKKNQLDDVDENVQLNKEVERLDEVRAELVDVEENNAIDDEDLFTSLNQRMDEGDDSSNGSDSEASDNSNDSSDSDGEGGGIEDPEISFGDSITDTLSDTASSSAESIDILQNMWDNANPDKEESI